MVHVQYLTQDRSLVQALGDGLWNRLQVRLAMVRSGMESYEV